MVLLLSQERCDCRYDIEGMDNTKAALDKNHSHFFLVDSGEEKYGGEIEFRAALEAYIGNIYGSV